MRPIWIADLVASGDFLPLLRFKIVKELLQAIRALDSDVSPIGDQGGEYTFSEWLIFDTRFVFMSNMTMPPELSDSRNGSPPNASESPSGDQLGSP